MEALLALAVVVQMLAIVLLVGMLRRERQDRRATQRHARWPQRTPAGVVPVASSTGTTATTEVLPAVDPLPPHDGTADATALLADLSVGQEPSPLYEQTRVALAAQQHDVEALLAASSLGTPEAEQMRAGVSASGELTGVEDEQADWESDLDGTPDVEHEGQGPHDDEPPPDSPVDETRTPAVASRAAPRYDWSRARARPAPPLHWGRGLMDHAAGEMKAKILSLAPICTSYRYPSVPVEEWIPGLVAGARLIARHRRGGGTWAVTG